MADLERNIDYPTPCPDPLGAYYAKVYFARKLPHKQIESAIIDLGRFSRNIETPALIFSESHSRLNSKLAEGSKYEKTQLQAADIAAICVMRLCGRTGRHAEDSTPVEGHRLERFGTYVVQWAKQVPLDEEIVPILSRGTHINQMRISRASRGKGLVNIEKLIHLPITDDEARRYKYIWHAAMAAPDLKGAHQPYVALHEPDGVDVAIEQRIILDEVL